MFFERGKILREIIFSAGIDIGTSTTQLIFSRLTIENLATSYTVPRISIVDKEIIYKSDIYFTPLLSQTEIDAKAVSEIVLNEYKKANISPKDIKTGAVIITGDTARKHNANVVLESLSGLAGDFVVATAGPDLESVLSGKGAGADRLSKELFKAVANIDIGGGTSNIAVFDRSIVKAVTCLDIGGRLIKIDKTTGKITYIYSKIAKLAKENNINIKENSLANVGDIRKICRLMANLLAEALLLTEKSSFYETIFTNNGKGLPSKTKIDAITFSGGVADYVYENSEKDLFKYGDIGIILGDEIRKCKHFEKVLILKSSETIRATVVGAGSHTTEISGSTIFYAKDKLPIKNIPIMRTSETEIKQSIQSILPLYMPEGKPEQVAIAFSGMGYSSFLEIQQLAQDIIQGAYEIIKSPYPLVIIIEQDIGKALGNAINVILEHSKEVICIDGIKTLSGDYIDIGKPMADGRVVPVVIKTLIFNS